MHKRLVIESGNQTNASKALIMLHGRGGSPEDILSIAQYLPVKDYALYAPQASGYSWYPQSFLAPPPANEPWLSSALEQIGTLADEIVQKGIPAKNIYFLGFSQGACLTLEYTCRHAQRYGGVVAFTGGLIGDRIYSERYKGNFEQTPVFIGTSDPDPHVPVDRVYESETILKNLSAAVTVKVYPSMGHTITEDELQKASRIVFS